MFNMIAEQNQIIRRHQDMLQKMMPLVEKIPAMERTVTSLEGRARQLETQAKETEKRTSRLEKRADETLIRMDQLGGIVNALSEKLQILEFNLSGQESEDAPVVVPVSRPTTSNTVQSAHSPSSNDAPSVDALTPGDNKISDHAVFLSRLPKGLCDNMKLSTVIQESVGYETSPDDVRVVSTEGTSDFAVVTVKSMKAATAFTKRLDNTGLKFAEEANAVKSLYFGKDIATATAALLTCLRPDTPLEDLEEHLKYMIEESGCSDQVTTLTCRFGRSQKSLGLCLLKCKSPEAMQCLVNELHGLEQAHGNTLQCRWLPKRDEEVFDDHLRLIKKHSFGETAENLLLVGNLSESVTDVALVHATKNVPIHEAEVLRDASEASLGLATVRLKEPVTPVHLQQLTESLAAKSAQVSCIPLTGKVMKSTLTPERRRIIARALVRHCKFLALSQAFKGVMSKRIEDPKKNLLNRVMDVESEVASLTRRAERAESIAAELKAQLAAMRNIEADTRFAENFDARVEGLLKSSNKKQEAKILGKIIKRMSDTGLFIAKDAESLEVNDEYIRKAMAMIIDALKKAAKEDRDRIVEMEGVLPYKLDTPALNAMIDEEDGDNESTNPLKRLKRLIQMETDDDIKQKLKVGGRSQGGRGGDVSSTNKSNPIILEQATEAILRQAMKDLSEQDKKIVNNRLNDMEQVLAEVKGKFYL